MRRLLVAGFGALMLAPIILFAATDRPAASADAGVPTDVALADIPAQLLPVYQAAARTRCSMPWEILAAIGKIETDHGRSTLPGVASGENAAGAGGPMQFLQATWDVYGHDGDGDGIKDRYNAVDAIWGAANYLCASGASTRPEAGDAATYVLRLQAALFVYNPSDVYVADVLAMAATYRAVGTGVGATDVNALLANPRLTLSSYARADLQAGVIDQRVVDFLGWAIQRHSITVSALKTGHDQYVSGTDRISNHFYGRAVDVAAVDGDAYRPSCIPCRVFTEETIALGIGRPNEIGQPWGDVVGPPGVFTDADHLDHEHAGWD